MAHNFVSKERTLIVIISEEFFAFDCHLFPARKQSLGGHSFKDDSWLATVAP
jgi:hypothetical protein